MEEVEPAKEIGLTEDAVLQAGVHVDGREVFEHLVATKNTFIIFVEGPAIARGVAGAECKFPDVGDGCPGAVATDIVTTDVEQDGGKPHVATIQHQWSI